jgi:hypothetical protein
MPALLAALLVTDVACGHGLVRQAPVLGDTSALGLGWMRVFTDTAFTVAVDTSRVERRPDGAYLLHFQTRWVRPHQTQAPMPFNREEISTILRCVPLSYKTVHVGVYLDDGPLVAEQGGAVANAESAPWKTPVPGTADERSFMAACSVVLGAPRGTAKRYVPNTYGSICSPPARRMTVRIHDLRATRYWLKRALTALVAPRSTSTADPPFASHGAEAAPAPCLPTRPEDQGSGTRQRSGAHSE